VGGGGWGGVRGVVFAPFEHLDHCEEVNRRLLDMLRPAGIPVVLLDRDITRFPLRSNYDLVALDNLQAGFLAADHLIRLGCRELRLLSEARAASSVDARAAGIREALLQRGVVASHELRIDGNPEDPEFIRRALCNCGIDAVICANDFTAARALKTLTLVGVSVPDDLRLVGFDDVRYATLVAVSLTTIRQPCREMATIAFRALEDRIRDAALPTRTILLAPALVVRDSCGAYANPARKTKGRARRRN